MCTLGACGRVLWEWQCKRMGNGACDQGGGGTWAKKKVTSQILMGEVVTGAREGTLDPGSPRVQKGFRLL